ncbi:MAG: hypothetical protein QGF12_08500 [SAR202 cluster bacterium]|jgi:hypothetical protein|nr:hypothetical protein [SAR202 cluster bacterium]
MAIFTLGQVNAWLDPTKAQIAALEGELEGVVTSKVLGSLEKRFDTSVWTTTSNTPELVQQTCALAYAGAIYSRAYSEDITGITDTYGIKLSADAEVMLEGILDGTYELRDLTGYTNPDQPQFYPTDSSTTLYDTDPSSKNATPMVFRMNQVF